jgi:hypothetical protein
MHSAFTRRGELHSLLQHTIVCFEEDISCPGALNRVIQLHGVKFFVVLGTIESGQTKNWIKILIDKKLCYISPFYIDTYTAVLWAPNKETNNALYIRQFQYL